MTTQQTQQGLIAWFTRNPVAANLLLVLIVLAGIYSIFTIRKQSFPTITLDTISIQVPYLGAAPEEVEEGVVLKIEDAVKRIEGIKKITSTSNEGMGSVTIEVAYNYDVLELLNEVKVQVDAIPRLPENTEKPVVYRVKPEQAVLWVQVYGDMSERTMKEYANSIRDEIVLLPGVSAAEVVGARAYEISVEVPETILREHNLSLSYVSEQIQKSSVNLPGGSIKTENGDILLRTTGQAYYADDFAKIVLKTNPDGSRLYLSDIANIRDGFVEYESYSRFNQLDSIGIQVKSVGEQNDLQIAKTVKQFIQDKQQTLPSVVKLKMWGDSSYYLQGRLDLMLNNMMMGAALVFIILSLFLRFRLAIWVIVGLFVSFLGALAMMPATGVSINMISLFAFILVLGIVVDDAIIIGESVHATTQAHGSSIETVIRGAQRVAMPATFGVLTTIVAFAPMLMVSGPSSPIWSSIGVVVMLCLAFSLVESKWILPSHLVGIKVTAKTESMWLPRFRKKVDKKLNHFIEHFYRPFLHLCLTFRYSTLAAFVGVLIVVGGLIGSGVVRFVFFPNLPSDYVQVSLTMEDGTSAELTNKTIGELEKALYQVDQKVQTQSGESLLGNSMAFNTGQTSGMIWAELDRSETRPINGFEAANRWRDAFGEMPGVRSVNFSGSIQGGAGADLAFLFRSDDLAQIDAAASELKEILKGYQGVYDVDDSFSGGKDEIKLSIKPEAQAQGLTLLDLARQVRLAFYGAEAQRIQRDEEEIKVMVRYPKAERTSISNLENMWIRVPSGAQVPFSSVAEYEIGEGYATIQRIDYQRSISVTAKADKALIEPGKVAAEIAEQVIPDILTKYPEVSFELTGASKEEKDAMASLAIGFLFALVVIYALMAIPLKSYSQPLIIMSVIPFGIVGAVIGHVIFGLAMSILSMFGIIALAGVVVNDSLIMVDFVNRARERGLAIKDAVVQAGTERFRAILLTSLTTFFGLIPIVLETSLQAQIVIPMAISLAFGILFSTVITLVLVPSLYLLLNDITQLKSRLAGKAAS
ncbi:efflux RND transporter permease subunit [Catenovulum adriaticum]|uniref:Efflux RND transporter permease subunit n=1 Tax=Catenovulum adriaticum TaxID=2984846 RepID=A0ABY7ALR8_9ALTE|nr:efflux RND transporter permease subunit [Catenovulum sp. TS8]WAJ69616.1 efflux RND transporter permease subunit [Catenovulum sp. TS8]